LPLMPAVGQAILNYLRKGRPQTSLREGFIKANVPLGPFARGSSLYKVFSRRIRQAGIKTEGKRGPHAIRYARAMSLLRANVSLKSMAMTAPHCASSVPCLSSSCTSFSNIFPGTKFAGHVSWSSG